MDSWRVEYAERVGQEAYSSDVSDEEWAFIAPYLALMSGTHSARMRCRRCSTGRSGRYAQAHRDG